MHEIEYIGGGPPRRQEGSLGPAKLWLALGAIAVVMVIFMQWFRGDLFSTTVKVAPASIAASEEVEGGQYSGFAMNAKAAVKTRRAVMDDEEKDEIAQDFREFIIPMAVTRAERFRLAIVGGELVGKDEALKLLAALEKELEVGTPLAMDAAWLKILYDRGPEKLTQEVQASLIDRHGWFGELALAFNRPVHDSFRRSAVGGRERILSTFKTIGRMQLIMFLVGIAVGFMLVRSADALQAAGQFDQSVPDENLHAFVLFSMGFVVILGLSLLPIGLGEDGSFGAAVVSELMIWGLLLAAAWPLVRKVPWSEFSRTVGLHMGQGLPVEAVIGIAAFLAWLPVTIGLGEALEALARLSTPLGIEGSPNGQPMFEAPPSDSSLLVFLSIVASVVWAPLVEEIMFRGFLYGWLRERLGFVLSMVITSVVFGIIHPYSPLGMIQVTASGFMFAILREWRGSLVAPMFAHAMHNGLIVAQSMAITNAIGG